MAKTREMLTMENTVFNVHYVIQIIQLHMTLMSPD